MLITIRGQEPVQARGLATFFAGAFRPFFLLGAVQAVLALGVWVGKYAGLVHFSTRWPGWWWHGHEMVFGFAVAAIAGFILTAAPKWTSSAAPKGWPVALFVLAWVLARAAAWSSAWLPELVLAAADQLLLLPLAAWTLGRVYRSRNRRNYPVPVLLLALAGADALFHLQLLGLFADDRPLGLYAGVYVVIVVATLISGRVVPAFTESALRHRQPEVQLTKRPQLGAAAVVVAALSLAAELVVDDGRVVGGLALVAALLLAARAIGWRAGRTWDQPIVWILHLGHGWLVFGFVLLALARGLELGSMPSALHAFTAGALGTLILAITTRASLGHSGRPLELSPWTVLAYGLITIGAALRVVVGILEPAGAASWYLVSGGAWALAFALFSIVYWPVLTQPRVDGRPG